MAEDERSDVYYLDRIDDLNAERAELRLQEIEIERAISKEDEAVNRSSREQFDRRNTANDIAAEVQ